LRILDLFSNKIFIKYTLIPAIPLFLFTVTAVDPYLWIGSEIHHFYIELFAVIFSGVIAFYYILHARNFNDTFSLFIGIGFSVSALIYLLHVAVSYSLMENSDFLKYFIPQTWFAGRVFLSSMLLVAIAKYSSVFPEDLVSSKIDPSDTQGNKTVRNSSTLNVDQKKISRKASKKPHNISYFPGNLCRNYRNSLFLHSFSSKCFRRLLLA